MTDRIVVQETPKTDPNATPLAGVEGNESRVTVDPAKLETSPSGTPEGELLAGKYKTVDELVKGYQELQTKLGAPKETPAAETPKAPEPAPTVDAEKTVTDAGFDMAALNAEYAKDGKLSDETMAKLAAKGITQEMAEGYIEGQKAKAEKYTTALAEAVGGKESMDALFAWANQNLSDAEKDAANATLQSMNEAQAKLVLQGLKSRFDAAMGTSPSLVQGETAPVAGVEPFRSNEQLVEAMRNPKYRNDPAYRAVVEQRLAVSKLF